MIEAELAAVRRHRGRPSPTGPGSSRSTRSTSPRRASSPSSCGPTSRRAATRVRGLRGHPRGPAPAGLRAWPSSSHAARAASAGRARRRGSSSAPERRRRRRLHGACARTTSRACASGSAASKPERWVRQTDFTNDEAVGYLADRLARLGVEDAPLEAGAVAGAEVLIGPRTTRSSSTGSPPSPAAPAHGPARLRRPPLPVAPPGDPDPAHQPVASRAPEAREATLLGRVGLRATNRGRRRGRERPP